MQVQHRRIRIYFYRTKLLILFKNFSKRLYRGYHLCKPFTILMKLNSVVTIKNVSFILTSIIPIYMKENKKLDKENSFLSFSCITNKIHILNIHIVLDMLRKRGAKVAPVCRNVARHYSSRFRISAVQLAEPR